MLSTARRNLQSYPSESEMKDLLTMVDTSAGVKNLKIDGGIRSYGVNTYQMVYTCKSEFNDVQIDFPFRIVVKDGDASPTSTPQSISSKFF